MPRVGSNGTPPMSTVFVETFTSYFESVTDPRVNNGLNYPLTELFFVALCGSICDCNSWVDVAEFGQANLTWFRKFCRSIGAFPRMTPSVKSSRGWPRQLSTGGAEMTNAGIRKPIPKEVSASHEKFGIWSSRSRRRPGLATHESSGSFESSASKRSVDKPYGTS